MKRINIIDNQFAHGTSLGSGDLPIYPTHFHWDRTLNSPGRYVFITENSFGSREAFSVLPERRVAFLIEPRSINPGAYHYVAEHAGEFAYILTHDREFLRHVPNAIYYPFGGCWIRPEDRRIHPKTKLISIIASDKKQTEGHKLRHEIIERFKSKIDVLGRGYNPVENKIEALKDYCYTIVIENEKSKGWFTEKLIDAFQTGTIPIYWGAPDIYDYFDGVKGIFNMDYLEELLKHEEAHHGSMAMNYKASESDIKKMFDISKKYVCPEDWIFEKYPYLFN